MSAWQFPGLQMHSYDVIVSDIPRAFTTWSKAGEVKSAQAQYETMPVDEIKALRVADLARPECLLCFFCTAADMATGLAAEIVRAWGFKPITEISWRKVTRNGKLRMGTGYRVRTMHEPILVAAIGGQFHDALPSTFDGLAREHSRKPDEFYRLLAKATPNATRCDLFSRERRAGYDSWGKEAGKFDHQRRASA